MWDIIETAQKHDVTLAIENCDDEHLPHMEYVLDNIDSKNLGFCFDSGHWHLFTRHVELINKYSDKLCALHLHDNIGKFPTTDKWHQDMHMLPFDGNVDFEYLAQEIAKTKYNGCIMLESRKSKRDNRPYRDITSEEFLNKARIHANVIGSMIESNRL